MSISNETKERLKEEILKAAAREFLSEGYHSASLDKIIKISGGSKSKIYNYFGNKRVLFIRCIEYLCVQTLSPLNDIVVKSNTLKEVLFSFGQSYLKIILSTKSIAVFRLVISESSRFAELGDIFLNSGPDNAKKLLISSINKCIEQNDKEKDLSAEEFATLFIDAISRNFQLRLLLTNEPLIEDHELERTVSNAINLMANSHVI